MNVRYTAFIALALVASAGPGCGSIDALWADIPPYEPGDEDAGADASELEDGGLADTALDLGPTDTADGGVDANDEDTDADAPLELSAPQNLRVVDTATSIQLDWDDVDGALGYEIQLDGGGWVPLDQSSDYDDMDAPSGTLTGALTVDATDGTVRDHVTLEGTSSVVGVAGVTRTYVVRAIAGGLVSPPSIEVSASREAPTDITYTWQFATPDQPTAFTGVTGAQALSSTDPDAAPTGDRRIYRLVASADNADGTIISNEDEGWRLAAIQVVAGNRHSCALLSNGKVKCWGRGVVGQLGYGDPADRGGNPGDMPTPDVNVGFDAVKIYTGAYSTCAQAESGTVRCWGNSSFAALGTGTTELVGDEPGDMPPNDLQVGGTIVDMHSHLFASCAVLDTGALRCWGYNQYVHLGQPNTTNTVGDEPGEMPPASVDLGANATRVVLGDYLACAVDANSRVRCWGGLTPTNPRMGLAPWPDEPIGDDLGEMPPSATSVTRDVRALSTSGAHTCTITTSGQLFCWGENDDGEQGVGDRSTYPADISIPTAPRSTNLPNQALTPYFTKYGLTNPGGFAQFVDVAVTNASSCVLTSTGAVACSGSSARTGLSADTTTMEWLDLSRPAVALSRNADAFHYCAILNNGTVKCWGADGNGRLGNESVPINLSDPSQTVRLW
jgi:alpha-tubulin suppressor-like RCC1 family protein